MEKESPHSNTSQASGPGEREESAHPIKVLIVDDHQALLYGIERLIEGQRPRMEVSATASDSARAMEAVRGECPDVVLLDLELGGENGLDLLPELLGRCGERTRVVVLTGSRDADLHDRAVRLGARGVILKHEPLKDIVKAIEKVMRGELWLDRATASRIFDKFSGRGGREPDPEAERAATLTPREREIVGLLCEGLRNDQIAQRLFVSEKTVRNNLTTIYHKLDVSNRLELILFAQRCGLAKAPGKSDA